MNEYELTLIVFGVLIGLLLSVIVRKMAENAKATTKKYKGFFT